MGSDTLHISVSKHCQGIDQYTIGLESGRLRPGTLLQVDDAFKVGSPALVNGYPEDSVRITSSFACLTSSVTMGILSRSRHRSRLPLQSKGVILPASRPPGGRNPGIENALLQDGLTVSSCVVVRTHLDAPLCRDSRDS